MIARCEISINPAMLADRSVGSDWRISPDAMKRAHAPIVRYVPVYRRLTYAVRLLYGSSPAARLVRQEP
jgi:hypothetical protein